MTSELPYHTPALLAESLEALDIKPGGIYVDATYGGGGHTSAVMARLDASAGGHIYAFDQDMDAIRRAPVDEERLTMVHSNFRFITNFMRFYDVDGVDGILADLGVSSHHFDATERGFSFRADGPLDMRMNRSAGMTAATLLREADRDTLSRIFKLYGELGQARKMADTIVGARESGHPLQTIGDLLEIVTPLIDPRKEKKELAQVFQALRIEVNHELDALADLLDGALKVLKPGGRLAVITYHSLEDRLVKNFMKTGNIEGRVEKDFFGRTEAPMRPLGNKPIVPTEEEVERNPRARSAKLRCAEKIGRGN
ncbi:MAG: 16S rRNA (cytosine(1402)-N(4))-methyltransferase RsmH [Muribaculaceae bacterium]|nr:16S rRNA (cytosine(1402)-N(4))-methyltransferase RsmH [Muribaculaceae bacterium]